MFVNCPDAIPELLPYLCDRLKDSKTGVEISAVTAIHEITGIKPKVIPSNNTKLI
jgi:hypothetical protein